MQLTYFKCVFLICFGKWPFETWPYERSHGNEAERSHGMEVAAVWIHSDITKSDGSNWLYIEVIWWCYSLGKRNAAKFCFGDVDWSGKDSMQVWNFLTVVAAGCFEIVNYKTFCVLTKIKIKINNKKKKYLLSLQWHYLAYFCLAVWVF